MKKQTVLSVLFACNFIYASEPETKSKVEIIQIHGQTVHVVDNTATLKKNGKEYRAQQIDLHCQQCGSPHQTLIVGNDVRQCDIEILKQALAQAKKQN